MRQRFQPGALQFPAAPVIDHEAIGDPAQIRARLANRHRLAVQQPHEHILRQIGGIACVAELAPQPPLQPAMVVVVKRVNMRMGGGFGSGHFISQPVSRPQQGVGCKCN